MTLTETLRATPFAGPKLSLWTERLRAALRRRALYSRTLTELGALSDRELADLGFSRSDLPRIARASVA